ncbi:MAG: LysM peptidoglycan-binding domain-containing protein [Anaerolineales bacterium]|nr:LysM peptidoglycan-binding domain-containing protein [Anaerolineales bacterium]
MLLLTLFLAACAPQSTSQPSLDSLMPYSTGTPSAIPAQLEGLLPAETPLPSPTPFIYKVTGNDTMSQIAEKFNVSLDALRAANPDVDPNAMSIGTELKIPNNSADLTGASTPTPVPVSVKQIGCYPTADQAMWCFVLVNNNFSDSIENISAQVTLVDSNGQAITSQAALSMLDILPPNTSLPLVTFFAPSIPADVKSQVQILTAIRLLPDDIRYLPAVIQNTLVQIDSSGRAAQVNGQVYLSPESKTASQVWVAAVAYDRAGRVVGVKRWESTAALEAGNSLPFEFMLSSVAGAIDQVEFAVEARP